MINYPLDINIDYSKSRVGSVANGSVWFDFTAGQRFFLADYHTHMSTGATEHFNTYHWRRSYPWLFISKTQSTITLGNNTVMSASRRRKKR